MQETTTSTFKDAVVSYHSRFTSMDVDTKLPNVVMIRNELKKYGINSTDLTVLTFLTGLMIDRSSFIDNIAPTEDVSSSFLNMHKRPKKLQKILKRLGIYTMISFEDKRGMNEEEDGTVPVTGSVLTFIGKTPDNRILMTDFKSHSLKSHKGVSKETWCGLAILRFCEQIQTYNLIEMNTLPQEENTFNVEDVQELIKGTGTTFKLSEEELEILKQKLPDMMNESSPSEELLEEDMITEAEFTELA
jgi:hypothetical protein